MGSEAIGVDFGGTALKAGRVVEGRVTARERASTPCGEPALMMDALAGLVKRLEPRPTGVGLAIPGEVDAGGRCWRLPNVPGFEGLPIGEELGRRLGCPVRVENDATAAALAELRHGHGRRLPLFVLFTLGTGIGGGLVLDGHVRRGRAGFAGELGHVLVETGPGAWPCACGLSGCLESLAGTAGLLRTWSELVGSPAETPEISRLAEAARGGDETAQAVFAAAGRALGTALAVIQNLLDLDAAVFTGGVAGSLELLLSSMQAALSARVFAPPLAEIPLLRSELGGDGGVIGAAELLR